MLDKLLGRIARVSHQLRRELDVHLARGLGLNFRVVLVEQGKRVVATCKHVGEEPLLERVHLGKVKALWEPCQA